MRKWSGFWTGGFAWKNGEWRINYPPATASDNYVSLRKRAMTLKSHYLAGTTENKEYLGLFKKAEAYLDECGIESADKRDVEMAKRLDISYIKNKRRANATILLEYLSRYAVFPQIMDNDCPLFVPIILETKQRDALRSYLISKDIYTPVHWPIEKTHILTEETKQLYESELSIICDQRYSQTEMQRIISEIHKFGIKL